MNADNPPYVEFIGGPQDGTEMEIPADGSDQPPPFYYFHHFQPQGLGWVLDGGRPTPPDFGLATYRREERLGMWEDADGVPMAFGIRYFYVYVP